MKDIAPELLEAVQYEFNSLYEKSPKIKRLLKAIKDGKATYKDANKYAIEVGEILAESFQNNLSSDALPDGHMYYNIADKVVRIPLEDNQKIVAEICAEVQDILNKENGLGLKGIAPKLNKEKVQGILDIVSGKENFDDIKYMLGESVVNFTQSTVDDAIRDNMEFQYESGLNPIIRRTVVGHCCEWCSRLAGTYDYKSAPKNVFRRHRFCRCIVEYIEPGRMESVHTKRDNSRQTRIQKIKDLEALDQRKLEEARRKNKR